MALIANPEYQFSMSNGGTPLEYTAYQTKATAKKLVHESQNPVLVRLVGQTAEGTEKIWYDAYPQGHPVPETATVYYNDEGGTVRAYAEIVERCVAGKWRKVAGE